MDSMCAESSSPRDERWLHTILSPTASRHTIQHQPFDATRSRPEGRLCHTTRTVDDHAADRTAVSPRLHLDVLAHRRALDSMCAQSSSLRDGASIAHAPLADGVETHDPTSATRCDQLAAGRSPALARHERWTTTPPTARTSHRVSTSTPWRMDSPWARCAPNQVLSVMQRRLHTIPSPIASRRSRQDY